MKTIKGLIIVSLTALLIASGCSKVLKSGQTIWKFDVEWPVNVIGQGSSSLFIKTPFDIFSLSKDKGKILWKTNYKTRTGVIVHDAFVDNRGIFVVVDGAKAGDSTEIHLLDARSGKQKWKHIIKIRGTATALFDDKTNIYVTIGLETEPLSSRLYAISKVNGRQLWTADFSDFSPYILNNEKVIYVIESDASITALDQNAGTVKWKQDYTSEDGLYTSNLMLAKQVLVLNVFRIENKDGLYQGKTIGLDPKNGEKKWEFSLGQDDQEAKVLASDNRVYLLSKQKVCVLDVKNGKKKWQFESKEDIVDALIDGNKLYILSEKISVLNLDSGRFMKELNVPQPLSDLMLIKDGILYSNYGSAAYEFNNEGIIFALDARTGEQIWRHNSKWTYDSGSYNDEGVSLPSITFSKGSIYFATSIFGEDVMGAGVVYALKQ